MNLVDAHQHYWRVDRGDYAWLHDAPAMLQHDFLPADLQAQRTAVGVTGSVLVQAAATEAETRYLFELARADRSILGVVGWVDFEAPDAPSRIDALRRDGGGLLLGLRPMAQDHPDPDWLARPTLDAAFDRMQEQGLAFDALVKPTQLPALQKRLQRERGLRVVLDHAGKPDIAHGSFDDWAAHIRALAALPDVHCKFSGLLTELAPGMPVDALDPYVDHLFACFGADRLVWGSDWPVLTLRDSYTHWLELARTLARQRAPHALDKIFGRNALAFYRPQRTPASTASAGDTP
ncbi:amidohydrolase family protein [Rhodanobacter sp. DHB23]|uniref:amidohydrolase family protein n=1 Tax=Rhodanobacter sp. DHB23 TaxID=2775923 RepID=UPI001784B13B|nr:amidohydrolase family protein [Rhodanobacter sp. DHB23]MBD8873026.1 amidohydrolase family protein [Rhodanobacter sp. DHB23]